MPWTRRWLTGPGTGSVSAPPMDFLQGLLDGSDPAAQGRMDMYMAIRPDADRGMPRWGIAPIHGLDGRIGIGRPLAVA